VPGRDIPKHRPLHVIGVSTDDDDFYGSAFVVYNVLLKYWDTIRDGFRMVGVGTNDEELYRKARSGVTWVMEDLSIIRWVNFTLVRVAIPRILTCSGFSP